MAACLEPDCFGAIADPFGGLRDLEAGVVRVLHGLSFIDDPTRILRAVRFEERYGFAMDPGTADAARRAVELDMLSEVSGARIREELLGILAEKAPGKAFARLEALGALAELLPAERGVGSAPAGHRAGGGGAGAPRAPVPATAQARGGAGCLRGLGR